MAPKKGKDEEKPSVEVHQGSPFDVTPRFFELRSWLSPNPDREDAFDLYATLRVNAAEVAIDDRLVEVRTIRAFLIFSLEGFKEDHQVPRFGALQLEAEHRTKVETKISTGGTLSARAGAKGSVTPLGPVGMVSGELSARGERSFQSVEKDKSEPVARRVIARPNCEWEFQEPSGITLDGDYLIATKLCSLLRIKGSNRTRVTGRLHVRQKELRFNHDDAGLLERAMTNKRRLLDLFLTQILSGDTSHRGPGVIFPSRVEIEL